VALEHVYRQRLNKLSRSHAPASQRLAVIQQLGRACLPIAELHLTEAETYAQATAELDPIVQQILDLLRQDDSGMWALDAFEDALAETGAIIDRYQARTGGPALHDLTHMSQSIKRIQDIWTKSKQHADGANDTVLRWRSQVAQLKGENSMESSHPAAIDGEDVF